LEKEKETMEELEEIMEELEELEKDSHLKFDKQMEQARN
jgi:hypothetical protein